MEINDCIICTQKATVLINKNAYFVYGIKCTFCGANIANCKTKESAIEQWNKHPPKYQEPDRQPESSLNYNIHRMYDKE